MEILVTKPNTRNWVIIEAVDARGDVFSFDYCGHVLIQYRMNGRVSNEYIRTFDGRSSGFNDIDTVILFIKSLDYNYANQI